MQRLQKIRLYALGGVVGGLSVACILCGFGVFYFFNAPLEGIFQLLSYSAVGTFPGILGALGVSWKQLGWPVAIFLLMAVLGYGFGNFLFAFIAQSVIFLFLFWIQTKEVFQKLIKSAERR